jgi:uracil-DNA glycosylase
MTIGDWSKYLSVEKEKEYFRNLYTFLNNRSTFDIYPPKGSWFKAFEYSSFTSSRVIILGQDPYHGEGQAEGLSFSVPKGITIPPSLRNIYKELNSDEVDFSQPEHGNLVSWAQQGVLLLNSVLTVEKNSSAAHANHGWEIFTDQVIRILNDNKQHLVFILWGAYANKKSGLIDSDRHLILSSAHPSPFSAHKGFFGCKHFSQANEYLLSTKQQPIRWSIPK